MIPIRNIYYMLAYAFRVLHQDGYNRVASEDFENTAELLTAILCKGIASEVKRGLCREYLTQEESLSSPKGKLEISESVKRQSLRKKQLLCRYDEFSVNAYSNRIIKTTLTALLRANISHERKQNLQKLLVFFEGVGLLDIRHIHWDIPYDRHNQTYRMIIELCRFVINGLLPNTANGVTEFMDYADDMAMERLFEKFILCYYKREHRDITVRSPQIVWQVTDVMGTRLPIMQTDIVLSNKNRKKTLIIDAKYYSTNLQQRYMTKTVYSSHLYQIFSYVKNWETYPGETVAGMLLYAKTDQTVQPDGTCQMSGNRISAKTLNLNCEFPQIAEQLNVIANWLRE